jgi:hypothetical protein
MQKISTLKAVTVRPSAHIEITTGTMPSKTDPDWKPEPCGLTREERRKIVADLLG